MCVCVCVFMHVHIQVVLEFTHYMQLCKKEEGRKEGWKAVYSILKN